MALLAGPVLADEQADMEGEPHMIGASLFGENEVDHEGAGEDASGGFSAEINLEAGTLCYFLEVDGLENVTAAHIHKGAKGKNGPPVVVLEVMEGDSDDVCVEVEAGVLNDIVENEDGYYVNVHTQSHPAGAIRGQLGS